MQQKRPNILWYCTDQQRFDTISALGNPYIHTPTLDRLVHEGVAFTHVYCQHPMCQPSRASFMTSLYPSTVRVRYNGVDRLPPEGEELLVTHLLAEHGYHCGLVGKLHLQACKQRREPRANDGFTHFEWSHGPTDASYDDYAQWSRQQGVQPENTWSREGRPGNQPIPPTQERDNGPSGLHHTTWLSERAISFLDSAREPWLLCVNSFDPHTPFDPPWEYYRRYRIEDMPLPHISEEGLKHLEDISKLNETELRQLAACYYAMIEQIDYEFGRILTFLSENGQLENTIVIFTSDHGEMLGDQGLIRKNWRYEGGMRVPLIWRAPERFQTGIVSQGLVELMDIAPTVLELAGIPVPKLMQGRSLLPILTGQVTPDRHRDFARAEFFAPGPDDTSRSGQIGLMYRDRRWKLLTTHPMDTNTGDCALFDMENDPWEFNNLWNDPAYSDIVHDLTVRSLESYILANDHGASKARGY